ncbi:MAG: hypothetical protein LBD51_10320 [Bifidobacteriaceae bacterium]|jgi:hypothetical protein|nr:hypothetical protein [Bifidobacteriaceae bacterium]
MRRLAAAAARPLGNWAVAFGIILSAQIAPYNVDMVTYVSAALRRADPSLFPGDLFAASSADAITPQFLNDLLLIGLMKLGLSMLGAALAIYLVCAAVLAGGLVALAASLSRSQSLPVAAALALMVAYLTIGEAIGANRVWINSWHNQSLAMALAVWALAFALRWRWWPAGWVAAACGLFHPQVGLYTGVVLAALLAFRPRPDQAGPTGPRPPRWRAAASLAPLAAALGLVQAAFWLTSSKAAFSDRDFVAVYAILRHPWHLVPSAWAWSKICWFALFAVLAAGALWLAARRGERPAVWRGWGVPSLALGGIGAGVVLANYVFVEVAPLGLVAKAYPERYFALFRLWVFILLAAALAKALERGQAGRALAIPAGAVAFEAAALGVSPSTGLMMALAATCLAIAAALSGRLPAGRRARAWRAASAAGLALCALASAATSVLTWSGGQLRLQQWSEFASPPPVTAADAAALASAVPKEAAFLADPDNQAYTALHVFGQRALAASVKNIPIDSAAMAQWLERLERLDVVERVGQGYQATGRPYEARPVADLAAAAGEFGAEYLVTTQDQAQRYLDSGLVELAGESQAFAIFRLR